MTKFTLTDHSKEVMTELEKQMAKALEMIGLSAEGYAKVNITNQKAVDTGNLRNSITHVVALDDKAVYIGTNVHYAPYVELGTGKYYPGGRDTPWLYQDSKGVWHRTSGMKARPYLVPAVRDHMDEYRKIAQDELES